MNIFLLLLAFTFQSVAANEWAFLTQGRKPDGSVANIHFAPQSIARNDDIVKVDIRATNHWGRYFREVWSGSDATMPEIGFVETQFILNCKGRTVTSNGGRIYNPSGYLIHTQNKQEKIKESPNTVGWMVFEYFCEKEGKKLTKPPILK